MLQTNVLSFGRNTTFILCVAQKLWRLHIWLRETTYKSYRNVLPSSLRNMLRLYVSTLGTRLQIPATLIVNNTKTRGTRLLIYATVIVHLIKHQGNQMHSSVHGVKLCCVIHNHTGWLSITNHSRTSVHPLSANSSIKMPANEMCERPPTVPILLT